MSWLGKLIPQTIRTTDNNKKSNIPEGLWSNCPGCKAVQYKAELERNLFVCTKCSYHTRISARHRLELLLDEKSEKDIKNELPFFDPLKFKDSKKYKDRYVAAQKSSGEKDALVAMEGTIEKMPVVAAAFEFGFMGGSMGSNVGEMFVQAVNRAIELDVPFITFTASGGARMQEGLNSLFQMAKTSAILNKLSSRKLPFIGILTDPTMGGVSASLAMLGDIIIAEPDALIGFAGPRVIEQTVRQKLPEGFQRSEFLLEKGHIDMVVDRRELKQNVASILNHLMSSRKRDGKKPS